MQTPPSSLNEADSLGVSIMIQECSPRARPKTAKPSLFIPCARDRTVTKRAKSCFSEVLNQPALHAASPPSLPLLRSLIHDRCKFVHHLLLDALELEVFPSVLANIKQKKKRK